MNLTHVRGFTMRYYFLFLSTLFIYYVLVIEECEKNLTNQRKLRKESSYFLVSALISWSQPDSNRKETNGLDWIDVFRKCQYRGQE